MAIVKLKTRKQFVAASKGRASRRKGVVVQCLPRRDRTEDIGVGFTATKKVGNAVIRNRAKRRLREAARHHLPQLGYGGNDYVFIARQSTAQMPWVQLLDDVERALLSLARSAPTQSGAD